MKKSFLILAVGSAILGFTSCSKDEKIAENNSINDANEISFRAFLTGMTRANDANLPSTGFKVAATKTSDASTVYFKNVGFTYNAGTYTSATKYYWPSAYNLDFYAYAPISTDVVGDGKQIVPTSDGTAYDADSYTKFKVTPATAAADQVDLVYARTNDWGKAALQLGTDGSHLIDGDPTGVTINFRHTESKVLIKLYNSNSAIKFTVKDASICNVNTSGLFTFAADNTDGQNTGTGTTLDAGQWSAQAGNGEYTVTDESSSKYNVASGSAAQVGSDWILIPQTLTYATAYSGSGVGAGFNGACIKVNLKIQNNAGSDAYIVGAADTYVTAMWPLMSTPTAWVPGKKYTYSVDLAGGGYFPTNTAAGIGTALDPILGATEIQFVSVTVDNWVDEAGNVYTGATPSTPVVP